jgi:hypothetical protein
MRLLFVSILFGANMVHAQLTFEFRWGTQKIIHEKSYYYKGDTIKFEELKAYLSDIYLTQNKELTKIADVWLVDFEDSTNVLFNEKIQNKEPASLSFNFGLDSIYHVNMEYAGELDPVHGMYWAWNTGYINFKMVARCSAVKSKNGLLDYHLGGYLKPHQTDRRLEFNNIGSILFLDLLPLFEKGIIQPELLPSVVLPGKEANRLMKSLSSEIAYD